MYVYIYFILLSINELIHVRHPLSRDIHIYRYVNMYIEHICIARDQRTDACI